MLSLQERTELLVEVADLTSRKAHSELLALLTSLPREVLLSEPELGLALAARWFHFSRFREARELADSLTEPCRRGGFDQLYRRHLVLHGNLLTEAGEVVAAEATFNEIFHRSNSAGDRRMAAVAMSSIGAVAAIRGEWIESLAALQSSLPAFQRAGDVHNLAGCHQNFGMVYRELGVHSRAEAHFDKACAFYAESRFDVSLTLASLAVERAQSMSEAGDTRLAEATARHALHRIEALENDVQPLTREKGEAFRVLGLVRLRTCDFDRAREFLELALAYAQRSQSKLLEGEVCEGLFEVAKACHEGAESRRRQSEALELYHLIHAHARANRLLARSRNAALG